MGEMDNDLSGDTPSRAATKSVAMIKKKKKNLGGPMNVDELKMNMNLLKAIGEIKR